MLELLIKNQRKIILTILLVVVLFLVLRTIFFEPPIDFPKHRLIAIEEGETLDNISSNLFEENLIRSPFFFRALVILRSGEKSAVAGDYYFDEPVSLWTMAKRIAGGKYGLDPLRITIKEGSLNRNIAKQLSEELEDFDPDKFLEMAEEGYMFPDTYFFLPNTSTEEVVKKMRETFDLKTKEIQEELVQRDGPSFEDVLKMASIIEREVYKEEDRGLVSSVLWNRIKIDMPLQVDASFVFINNKGTKDLTLNDLDIDSEYNSYNTLGLPPTPISNPGLEAIYAAAYPDETEYLYFLSDDSGNTYFAENFEEHKLNKAKYLR